MKVKLLVMVIIVLLISIVEADEIILKNGQVLEGTIKSEDTNEIIVEVKTTKSNAELVNIKKTDVVDIFKGTANQIYDQKAKKITGDDEKAKKAHLELAKWCEAKNLRDFAKKEKVASGEFEKCSSCNGKGRVDCSFCKAKGYIERDCVKCEGSGSVKCPKGAYKTCPKCDGQGYFNTKDLTGQGYGGSVACRDCGGQGRIICSICKGTNIIKCSTCIGKGIEKVQCAGCIGKGWTAPLKLDSWN